MIQPNPWERSNSMDTREAKVNELDSGACPLIRVHNNREFTSCAGVDVKDVFRVPFVLSHLPFSAFLTAIVKTCRQGQSRFIRWAFSGKNNVMMLMSFLCALSRDIWVHLVGQQNWDHPVDIQMVSSLPIKRLLSTDNREDQSKAHPSQERRPSEEDHFLLVVLESKAQQETRTNIIPNRVVVMGFSLVSTCSSKNSSNSAAIDITTKHHLLSRSITHFMRVILSKLAFPAWCFVMDLFGRLWCLLKPFGLTWQCWMTSRWPSVDRRFGPFLYSFRCYRLLSGLFT